MTDPEKAIWRELLMEQRILWRVKGDLEAQLEQIGQKMQKILDAPQFDPQAPDQNVVKLK